MIKLGQIAEFTYTNYKGERERRRAIPLELRYGTTPHYEQPQWLLHCFDLTRKEERTFALKDIETPTVLPPEMFGVSSCRPPHTPG